LHPIPNFHVSSRSNYPQGIAPNPEFYVLEFQTAY